MKRGRLSYRSETQKALMWGRWRKGDSVQHIAQPFARNHSVVKTSSLRFIAPGGAFPTRVSPSGLLTFLPPDARRAPADPLPAFRFCEFACRPSS